MPLKPNEREYRSMAEMRASSEAESYIVEGYASTFDPYKLYSYDGVDYFEQIDKKAFDNADMSDVIMQYDHEGRVYARQSNGTLELSIDDNGLKVRADLSRTAGARELYEDIKAENITQMSFAFTVDNDGYDSKTHTRNIYSIKRIYDVSAVSIPANEYTSIQARDYFNGVIELERAERLEAEKRQAIIESIRTHVKED